MELPHIPSVEMDMAQINVDPPPHRDGMTEGVFAFFVSACLASIGNVWLMPLMPLYAEVLAVLAVSLLIACLIMRWIARRSHARRLWYSQNTHATPMARDARNAETPQKLAQAKASGAFDRWEN